MISRDHDSEGVDRRTLIKRMLTAGSIGYVAPMILASSAPASAQVISGACSNPGCASGVCGPSGSNCACITIVGGATACVVAFCTDIAATVAEIVAELALAHGASLERLVADP